MYKIHKFQLELKVQQIIEVPIEHKFISAQMQNDNICLWAEVNTNTNKKSIKIYLVGTGHDFPLKAHYIGTVQENSYVWHIYAGSI